MNLFKIFYSRRKTKSFHIKEVFTISYANRRANTLNNSERCARIYRKHRLFCEKSTELNHKTKDFLLISKKQNFKLVINNFI
jgi:hypothetical protein